MQSIDCQRGASCLSASVTNANEPTIAYTCFMWTFQIHIDQLSGCERTRACNTITSTNTRWGICNNFICVCLSLQRCNIYLVFIEICQYCRNCDKWCSRRTWTTSRMKWKDIEKQKKNYNNNNNNRKNDIKIMKTFVHDSPLCKLEFARK